MVRALLIALVAVGLVGTMIGAGLMLRQSLGQGEADPLLVAGRQ